MSKFVEWKPRAISTNGKFGKLTILKTCKKVGTYRYYALCQCDCGSPPKPIRLDGIRNGHVTSCGCAHREAVTTHGKWGSPLLNVHRGMMSRCYKPANKRFSCYGGRGITVCERWHDIHHFCEDMEPSYQPGLLIERMNNDKGYSPENCKWATHREQTRNYRRNLIFTHDGKTLCLQEWSEVLSIRYPLLWYRLRRLGWSFERAIGTPKIPASESCRKARDVQWTKHHQSL